ncbi:MAG: cation:proton antiporter, partial [Spirochaetia bacterium]|nr:cation:proton antiporter [Spirochaetia bacterium]
LMKELLNRLRFTYEGIYGVFSLAFAFFIFGGVDQLGGSGFLAVYLTGIIAGNSTIIQKKTLVRFWDSQAWLSQIAMFLTLGLFVFPSKLPPILVPGILISVFLILIARPLAVFISLARSGFGFRKKLFLSWVGIRGAAPIILATFPLTAAVPDAEGLFHMVFFIVLISALAQGWSLPLVAKLLGLLSNSNGESKSPIETRLVEGWDGETTDLIVPFGSIWAGKSVVEIPLPEETLLLLVCRDGKYIVPSGGTILQELDVVTLLLKKQNLGSVSEIFSRARA